MGAPVSEAPRRLLLDVHRWTLVTRVLLLGTAFMTLLVLGAISVLQAQSQVARVEDTLRARLLPAVEAGRQLTTAVVDQETGLRGFVLTRDDSFLVPYDQGQAEQQAATTALRELLSGRPGPLRELDGVQQAVDAWRRDVAATDLARASKGLPPDAAVTRADKERFDSVRDRLEELQAGTTSLVSAAEQQRLRYQGSFTARLLVLLAALGVLGLALVVLLYRWAVRPVVRLRQLLRSVAGGQTEQPIMVDGPPEVREIAADADLMRVSLLEQVRVAQRSRESLEQHGPVVLALASLLATHDVTLPTGFAAELTHVPAEGSLAGDVATVRTLPDGRVALLVLDVSGHGAWAGLLAVRLRDTLMSALGCTAEPDVAIARAAELFEDGPDTAFGEAFATCLLVVLRPSGGAITYVNAGHPPAFLMGPDGTAQELASTGPLISSLGGPWSNGHARVQRGGALLAYTDGLTEARDAGGQQFGEQRLLETALTAQGRPRAMVDACVAAARAFSPSAPQDDLTCLALTRD